MSVKVIERKVLSSTAGSVVFSNIPSTYKTLVLMTSARTSQAQIYGGDRITVNSVSSGYNVSTFQGLTTGSPPVVTYAHSDTAIPYFDSPGASTTSNIFGNIRIVFPNYASGNNKVFYGESIIENYGNESRVGVTDGNISTTAAISSVTIAAPGANTFAANSTFTLYGIK